MTVSYSQNCQKDSFSTFGKLLFRWSGSVYKILYKEGIIFFLIFITISLITIYALDENQKLVFINVVQYFKRGTNVLPLTFVMGNFVSFVVSDRWKNILATIPWPDRYYLVLSCWLISTKLSALPWMNLFTLLHLFLYLTLRLMLMLALFMSSIVALMIPFKWHHISNSKSSTSAWMASLH